MEIIQKMQFKACRRWVLLLVWCFSFGQINIGRSIFKLLEFKSIMLMIL